MLRGVNDKEHVQDGVNPDQGDIRDLFSFQLQRLAGLSTRIATLSIQPRFGVTTREWRALAVLDFLGEATLQDLARQSGIQKSQMSRIVSALIKRRLIGSVGNPNDKRSVLLHLTAEGAALTHEILKHSRERNRRMISCLSTAELNIMVEYMQRVFENSLLSYKELKTIFGVVDVEERGESDD